MYIYSLSKSQLSNLFIILLSVSVCSSETEGIIILSSKLFVIIKKRVLPYLC